MIKEGDRVTPCGWMLDTEKPTGVVKELVPGLQRIWLVEWSDGRTSRTAEAVLDVVVEARIDGTTCPACRVVVPLGQYCGCLMKWRG